MLTHSHAHTHSEPSEELLWAANEMEDPVKWELSRIPVATSLYGTQWMAELNMSVHMSLFVYLCVRERLNVCVCAYRAHLCVQTFMCAQVHCLRA